MKVLIIDDEPHFCKYIANEFKNYCGIDAFVLERYTDLDAVLDDSFAAVILDVMMPILPNFFSKQEEAAARGGYHTGFIIFERIRKKYPKLPIVFFTYFKSKIFCDEYSIILRKPELGTTIIKQVCSFIDICSLK
jgi:CheY-like chemotaxis protein